MGMGGGFCAVDVASPAMDGRGPRGAWRHTMKTRPYKPRRTWRRGGFACNATGRGCPHTPRWTAHRAAAHVKPAPALQYDPPALPGDPCTNGHETRPRRVRGVTPWDGGRVLRRGHGVAGHGRPRSAEGMASHRGVRGGFCAVDMASPAMAGRGPRGARRHTVGWGAGFAPWTWRRRPWTGVVGGGHGVTPWDGGRVLRRGHGVAGHGRPRSAEGTASHRGMGGGFCAVDMASPAMAGRGPRGARRHTVGWGAGFTPLTWCRRQWPAAVGGGYGVTP